MAVQSVACPGCKATLKASEEMAGKKAKCKKCGTSFRIPGGGDPSGDTAGDAQMLSAMDLPAPAEASPFDFAAPTPMPENKPTPPEKKAAVIPKAEPRKPPEPPKSAAKPLPKAPTPKPKKEEEVIPAASPVEDESPAADPLSFDDADEVPTVASGDPFAFSTAPAPAKAKSKEKKAAPKEEDSEDDGELPAGEPVATPAKRGKYHSKTGGGGSGKLIIAAVVFAVVVGAIVGGVLVYLNSKKGPEQASNEKKGEPPPPAPGEAPPPPKADNTKDAKGTEPPPNPKEKSIPKRDPVGKKQPSAAGGGAMLGLPPGRTIAFLPQAPKLAPVQEPSNRLQVVPNLPGKSDNAFAAARKVFPPLKRDIDVGVLWQTEAGFQGTGEKLLLGIYSPQTGKQANQIVVDGDGSAEPACDLSVTADLFAHAHTKDNKVTIWDTRAGTKVVDGFNPYAGKKDLKLAAVYLTEPPLIFIAVSTTGAVHAFKVKEQEPVPGEFVPAKPSSKPLVAGKHIAPGPGRQSVIVLVGGSFYAVGVAGGMVSSSEVARLDGDVGRSFGIAASGSQKLLFAFETDDAGKKEKAVMEVRGDGNHVFYRWPDKDAGEPAVVGWVGDDLGMVGSDRGSCVWFESEGKEFKPVGLARTPMDKGRHVASDGHWTLLPDPANPKQCVLVEYSKPQSGIVGALDSAKQPPSVLLTDKGLLK